MICSSSKKRWTRCRKVQNTRRPLKTHCSHQRGSTQPKSASYIGATSVENPRRAHTFGERPCPIFMTPRAALIRAERRLCADVIQGCGRARLGFALNSRFQRCSVLRQLAYKDCLDPTLLFRGDHSLGGLLQHVDCFSRGFHRMKKAQEPS